MASAAGDDAKQAAVAIAVEAGWDFLVKQCDVLIKTSAMRGDLLELQRSSARLTAQASSLIRRQGNCPGICADR